MKDPLASINISKNYRSVCISSLTVKLMDWVVILLGGEALGLSELQFAYQANCSTLQCTWAGLETIDYFLKRGSEVFTIATDMSKAFDLALHSKMFEKMFEAKLATIFIRYLYTEIRLQMYSGTCVKDLKTSRYAMEPDKGEYLLP